MNALNLVNQLNDRVEECFKIAEHYYGKVFDRIPVFFIQKGTTGGYVTHRTKFKANGSFMTKVQYPASITFNMPLFKENPEEYFNQIIPHEVAHAIDLYVNGSTSHRANWKSIMERVYKVQPKRTHDMDTTNVKARVVKRDHVYVCECREHHMTNYKHNKIQSGVKYRCTVCKTRLYLKDQ